nr:MAG TPA: antirepressor protein [Caudoviricetes sp.]
MLSSFFLINSSSYLLSDSYIQTGQNKLFEWLRNNGYLIKRKGSDWNMPTQKAISDRTE